MKLLSLIRIFMACLALQCCIAKAVGQTPAEISGKGEVPDGPFLARAPAFSTWSTTIAEAGSNSGGKSGESGGGQRSEDAKAPKTVVATSKTGKIYKQVYSDHFGRPWVTWCFDGNQALIWPGSNNIILGRNPTNPNFTSDFTQADFQGVEWVSAENFVKLASVNGKKCLTFSKNNVMAVPVEPLPETSKFVQTKDIDPRAPRKRTPQQMRTVSETWVAAVDFETRLPIFAKKGGVAFSYQFQSPPTIALEVPKEVLSALQAQNNIRKDFGRGGNGPRPY